jgi:hypothetical protein
MVNLLGMFEVTTLTAARPTANLKKMSDASSIF